MGHFRPRRSQQQDQPCPLCIRKRPTLVSGPLVAKGQKATTQRSNQHRKRDRQCGGLSGTVVDLLWHFVVTNKRTSRQNHAESALPPRADIRFRGCNGRQLRGGPLLDGLP